MAHLDHLREYKKRYRETHRSEKAARQAIRNYRERGASGGHTPQEWREKCELFAWCCAYCGERKPLTRDHKVPIVRGGSNDITNILPACQRCNRHKATRNTSEYLALLANRRAA